MPTSSIPSNPSQSKSHPPTSSLSLSLSLHSTSSSTPNLDSSPPHDPSYLDDTPPDPSPSAPVAPSTISNTASKTAAKTFAPSAPQAARPSIDDGGSGSDIEMGPVTGQGHRRRHSSLMSSVGQSSNTRSHSRGQSLRIPQSPLRDDPKIVEEDAEDDGSNMGKDDSGSDFLSDEDLHDDEETGLTNKDRRRRQKKRDRNTRLDQRIAQEKSLSPDEQKEADKDVMKSLAVNGTLILLWYFFSLSISLYNKWMFDQDRLNFAFPLFTTSLHMVVQFILSVIVLYFVPSLRPSRGHSSDMGSSRHEMEPSSTGGMTKMFYLTRIGPCGAATGLDIGLGNTSLKFISLTFYTMCKSSSLAFVLLFAFAFRLETPTWRLVLIISTMTLGVVLMVFGEVEFKFGGFFLVISAAFFSGLRWGLTQILLLRNPATSNPFASIFFLTPVMFVILVFLAIPVEGFWNLLEGLRALSAEWGPVMTPLFLLFPGCIAFCMTASEFALLQRTSVVTLSIAGIFKEVVTISAASLVFHDQLTLINFIGLLVTMAAIVAYNYIKISKMRQDAQLDVHDRHLAQDGSYTGSIFSGSDLDDDAEETGLLREHDTLVTTDGDFQPLLRPSSAAGPSNERRLD